MQSRPTVPELIRQVSQVSVNCRKMITPNVNKAAKYKCKKCKLAASYNGDKTK